MWSAAPPLFKSVPLAPHSPPQTPTSSPTTVCTAVAPEQLPRNSQFPCMPFSYSLADDPSTSSVPEPLPSPAFVLQLQDSHHLSPYSQPIHPAHPDLSLISPDTVSSTPPWTKTGFGLLPILQDQEHEDEIGIRLAGSERLTDGYDADSSSEHDGDDPLFSGPANENADEHAHRYAYGHAAVRRFMTTSWVVEELSDVDPMESESERNEIVKPSGFEDGESVRASSRGRRHRYYELDRSMLRDFRNLDVSSSTDSDPDDNDDTDDPHPAARRAFDRIQRTIRLKRRSLSMASIGSKRTVSELSGSDGDREDVQRPHVDFNQAGSSARRLRRKTERWSIQFHDVAPRLNPPRIDEQDEPDETGNHGAAATSAAAASATRFTSSSSALPSPAVDPMISDDVELMNELPYCTLEIIEAD